MRKRNRLRSCDHLSRNPIVSQILSQSASNCAAVKRIARGSEVVPEVTLSKSVRRPAGHGEWFRANKFEFRLLDHEAQARAAKLLNLLAPVRRDIRIP